MVLGLLIGCKPPISVPVRPELEVRYRPEEARGASAQELLARVPGARWDAGLRAATEELLGASTNRNVRIPPQAANAAAARQGFPGQVRFARHLNGGAFPDILLDDLFVMSGRVPLDVALARRDYGDGLTLWILGWAPHIVDMDPLPALLPLDGQLMLRIDAAVQHTSRLFIAPPNSPVEELHIQPGVARWLDRFHVPGTYRMEVIVGENEHSRVGLLFSVFVDSAPEPLPLLDATPPPPPHPQKAEQALYAALQDLRAERGLPPVIRFTLFEPVAREHSAYMAASGQVRHSIPGLTEGVPTRARLQTQPAAQHHESVAAAASAAEAMDLIIDSPAHLQSLLCETCTHASIGAALEPALDRPPRLFITWELLEFPVGTPRPFYP